MNVRFIAKKEFHKEQAKLTYEQKVAQVMELQKIDLEFRKSRNAPIQNHEYVWNLDQKYKRNQ